MTLTQRHILWILGLSVFAVFCCFMVLASIVLFEPSQPALTDQVAVASTELPTPTISPTALPSPTQEPIPTLTSLPSPTKEASPTPRPTIPPGWQCYRSIGNTFNFARPAQWPLNSEDANGGTFTVPGAFALFAQYGDFASSRMTIDLMQATLSQTFEAYPYTVFRRGSSGIHTGPSGNTIFVDFYLGGECPYRRSAIFWYVEAKNYLRSHTRP